MDIFMLESDYEGILVQILVSDCSTTVVCDSFGRCLHM